MASTSGGWLTSAPTARASPPSPSTAATTRAASSLPRRKPTATRKPRLASNRHLAAPIPREPPVTSATGAASTPLGTLDPDDTGPSSGSLAEPTASRAVTTAAPLVEDDHADDDRSVDHPLPEGRDVE